MHIDTMAHKTIRLLARARTLCLSPSHSTGISPLLALVGSGMLVARFEPRASPPRVGDDDVGFFYVYDIDISFAFSLSYHSCVAGGHAASRGLRGSGVWNSIQNRNAEPLAWWGLVSLLRCCVCVAALLRCCGA